MDYIDLFYELSKNIHGDNTWFAKSGKGGNVYILYPEFRISNSDESSHDIKDLIVKFKFETDTGVLYSSIYGARVTVTALEYHNSYVHSHLYTSQRFWSFGDFCLGDTEIYNMLLDIAMFTSSQPFTRDIAEKMEYLIHFVGIFIEWESLEGVPYISIDDLSTPSTVDYSSGLTDFIRFSFRFMNDMENLSLSYHTEFPYVRPIYDKHFEKYMQACTNVRENVTTYGVYIGSASTDTLAYLKSDNKNEVTLGGRKFICKITHDGEQEEQPNIQQRVPKIYRDAFEKRLSERLSTWAIKAYPNKSSRIKRDAKTVNNAESLFKDIVSVPKV